MNNNADTPSRALVITGASRGIGLATASRFLESGYKVVNISRTPVAIDGVVQLCADLSAPDWQDAIAADLLAAVNGVQTLVAVHNAALQPPGAVQDLQPEVLRQVMELNVVAPTILNSLLLPHMGRGSAIIYIGSTMSFKATAGIAAYVASKHAVLGLMRSTCQDFAGKGIHTACVCPGFTDTEMLRCFGGDALEHLASRSTQGRLVQPEEVAASIQFCAENPVVNGSLVKADLGFVEG
ncbi:3-oxoacyl-[acyl-carrier-protein] reductase FabG [Halioglobus japonicus]|nr:3-oxoacyl-[acyl-carrier-protein] reductase FabG [Halioglobus japonicus]